MACHVRTSIEESRPKAGRDSMDDGSLDRPNSGAGFRLPSLSSTVSTIVEGELVSLGFFS